MPVDLRLLRYVIAVAEEQGFQDAADRLHIAQPALSRQVRQLERELGVELFHRRPTRVTEAGRVLVENARRVLADVERAVERTRLVARGDAGTVRLGYTFTAALDEVPRLLARLQRDHPQLEVEMGERWGAELVASLEDGAFDVVVGHHLARSTRLSSAVLRHEGLAAVLQSGHPLAERTGLALHELRGETFRMLPRRLAPLYFDYVVAAVQSAGVDLDVWQNPRAGLRDLSVGDLGGFTIAPSSVGGRLPRGVACVPLTDPLPPIDLSILWQPTTMPSPTQLVVQTARRLASTEDRPLEDTVWHLPRALVTPSIGRWEGSGRWEDRPASA
jgi:DNA-binding transcriptional LysR family regulator